MLIDEVEDEDDTRKRLQAFLQPWTIASLVNGWTEDGGSYPGQIVRDCGARAVRRVCVSACKSFVDHIVEA